MLNVFNLVLVDGEGLYQYHTRRRGQKGVLHSEYEKYFAGPANIILFCISLLSKLKEIRW